LMPSVAQAVVGRCMPLQSGDDDSERAAGAGLCGFVLAVRFKPLAWLKTRRDLNPGDGSGDSVQGVRKACERASRRYVVVLASPHALLTRCPPRRNRRGDKPTAISGRCVPTALARKNPEGYE
ncbi:MAG: hypothetical protein RSB42_13725, partial [Comamonas sp.]